MEDDSSKSQSLFPLETCPHISDEAFNLFHSIDRELYTRLIHNLGRDPVESVQVMAFWMWLERERIDMNLIKRMLSLPPASLNELADESTACLRCAESDKFRLGDRNGNEIKLLPEFLSSPVVSLRFFHENRIAVLRGVTKIINTVCARAFNDILWRAWRGKAAADGGGASGGNGGPAARVPVHFMGGGNHEVGESSREAERRVGSGGGGLAPPFMPMWYNPHLDAPLVPLPQGGGLIRMPPPPPRQHVSSHPPPVVADAIGHPFHMLATGGFPVYDLAAQRQKISYELGEMLGRNLTINNREETINAINGDQDQQEVPPDDRTIFLTFSKGYPTSEDEVREFFTRRFGDFIEDLIMQEVGEEEQVLYARMVAKSMAVIDEIVGGSKAKYSINGKHVWARKYVKKQQQAASSLQSRSPPRGDPSASSSSSTQGASFSP